MREIFVMNALLALKKKASAVSLLRDNIQSESVNKNFLLMIVGSIFVDTFM